MKFLPVKKQNTKRKIFIQEGIRTSLPKPKFPRVIFWKNKTNSSC